MTRHDQIRPAQICALSAAEMEAAVTHASNGRHPVFVIVTHSFELLSRDRLRINRSVVKRFEPIAAYIAKHRDLQTSGFNQLSVATLLNDQEKLKRLESSRLRSGIRMAEQLWGTWRYEHSVKPIG